MPVTKAQKEAILKELIDQFSRTKSVIFADYRGLSVKDLSALRRELRKGGSEMTVGKKTLMRIAAKKNNLPEVTDDAMAGPVAATFSYEDELNGVKVLFKFSKTNEKLQLLGGIIEGKFVTAAVVKEYAKLPGREELLAKFMGSAQAPVSNMVGLLSNLMGSFVRVLNAYNEKRS